MTAFFKKVDEVATKVPFVRELWQKLGMQLQDADPTFNRITSTMKSVATKAEVVEKGILNAFSDPKIKAAQKSEK